MIKKEGNKYRSTTVKLHGYEYVLWWEFQTYKTNIYEAINTIRFVLDAKTRYRLKSQNKNVKS